MCGKVSRLFGPLSEATAQIEALTQQGSCVGESYVIYVLVDPRTKHVRYVGKTAAEKIRRAAYRKCSGATAGSSVGRWLAELSALGLRPRFVVVTRITGKWTRAVARAAERLMVEAYAERDDGHLLLNVCLNPRHRKHQKPARTITFDGCTMTKKEWAAAIGITRQALSLRLKKHSIEVALRPRATA